MKDLKVTVELEDCMTNEMESITNQEVENMDELDLDDDIEKELMPPGEIEEALERSFGKRKEKKKE